MKMKFTIVEVLVIILVFAALLLTATRDIGFAQEKTVPDPYPPAASPAPAPKAAIPLTEPEKKDLYINQLEIDNLNMKLTELHDQAVKLMQLKPQLNKQTQALAAQFAKTHSIDIDAYDLDIPTWSFVPKGREAGDRVQKTEPAAQNPAANAPPAAKAK
jgi:cell shape-determining protein MreC